MDEYIKNWLIIMYKGEIEASKVSISNEHLWEFGYEFEKEAGYNPHTENIKRLNEYIKLLENYIKELED